MSKKSPELSPSQGSLFQQTPPPHPQTIPVPTFPSDPAEKLLGHQEPQIVYGKPGSYVDIAERATQLDTSLTAFGKRNQRLGFDVASNARQYKAPIWGRYHEKTPIVQEGAQLNSENFLEEAKKSFWRATGYTALRATGLVSDEEINASGRKMWREFSVKYADPDKREKRNTYKRQLKKSIKSTHKITEQIAA